MVPKMMNVKPWAGIMLELLLGENRTWAKSGCFPSVNNAHTRSFRPRRLHHTPNRSVEQVHRSTHPHTLAVFDLLDKTYRYARVFLSDLDRDSEITKGPRIIFTVRWTERWSTSQRFLLEIDLSART